MTSFALFRLPYADRCTLMEQTEGEPLCFETASQLSGCQGFVVAPFSVHPSQPILLIRPDRVGEWLVEDEGLEAACGGLDVQATVSADGYDQQTYTADFNTFHQALAAGTFQKLVLARCSTEPFASHPSPFELFRRACRRYPRLFVALVSTAVSGTWLVASPEPLLEEQGPSWHTVALAGTMRLTGSDLDGEGEGLNWSVKDIREQRYVATYIADVLRCQGISFNEEGPRTVRAAHLVHLRSDFTFPLDNKCTRASSLICALHPTPAVCGLPKDGALRFIDANEHTARRYYSGYMGPLNLSEQQAPWGCGTRLYVSLRCMQMLTNGYRLYAGGGLLPESTCQKEWMETEAKMDTMRQLFNHNA